MICATHGEHSTGVGADNDANLVARDISFSRNTIQSSLRVAERQYPWRSKMASRRTAGCGETDTKVAELAKFRSVT